MAERMDSSIKRIIQQNQRATAEVRLHIEESSLLHQENKILAEERARLVQEVETKVQMEQGFVSRNAKQSRDIRQANEKLLALERTMQAMVDQFEQERAFMREQWTAATENMAREVDAHKRLAQVPPTALLTCSRHGGLCASDAGAWDRAHASAAAACSSKSRTPKISGGSRKRSCCSARRRRHFSSARSST